MFGYKLLPDFGRKPTRLPTSQVAPDPMISIQDVWQQAMDDPYNLLARFWYIADGSRVRYSVHAVGTTPTAGIGDVFDYGPLQHQRVSFNWDQMQDPDLLTCGNQQMNPHMEQYRQPGQEPFIPPVAPPMTAGQMFRKWGWIPTILIGNEMFKRSHERHERDMARYAQYTRDHEDRMAGRRVTR